jgi:UDP:flavonoid glycosyltransferase YjiC (YdhE family)
MRVLCATTANDGHFGPLLPFAAACARAGHEVRVAAPASFAAAVARAGLAHAPFPDAPPQLVGPLMAALPQMPVEETDDVVIREVFGRIDAQAALPSLLDTVRSWRPHLVVRESAEIASLAAAERAGVPHAHVCIGMHEVATRFARSIAGPLEELGRLAGLPDGRMTAGLAAEPVFSLVPEFLDAATVDGRWAGDPFHRYHEPPPDATVQLPDGRGGGDRPLVYVTFGTVTGSLPPFADVFGRALDALADLDADVVMTVGRRLDLAALGPVPANASVVPWLPQAAVLARAAAMLGHGGFGTTMGALAAGVPQVVAPLFTFDQVVNGDHVAAVGAGLAVPRGPGVVEDAAEHLRRLLTDRSYADAAGRVAARMRELPRPDEAVAVLSALAG